MPTRTAEEIYRFVQLRAECDLSMCQNGTVTLSLLMVTIGCDYRTRSALDVVSFFERNNLVGIQTDHQVSDVIINLS